jgi:hypothetical protein
MGRFGNIDETQHHGEQHCEQRTHPNGAVPNYSICEAQQQGLMETSSGARAAISGWEVPRERCRGIPRDALAPGVALRLAGLVADLGGTREQKNRRSQIGRDPQNW